MTTTRMVAAQQVLPDHELAVLEVFIWFALIFFTAMSAYWFYIRFIRDGDVVKEANLIRAEYRSIESYLEEWGGASTKTAIAETRALDKDRS